MELLSLQLEQAGLAWKLASFAVGVAGGGVGPGEGRSSHWVSSDFLERWEADKLRKHQFDCHSC